MTDDLQPLVDEILHSKKYRGMGVAESTVRDLLAQELPRHRHRKDALDAVRAKLHNVAAPYLGDPDYTAASAALDSAFASAQPGVVEAECERILNAHASTRERMGILAEFYRGLWAAVGQPETILDLACGLNPFALRWMGLPRGVRYHAYDLHGPRIDLINHYFRLEGLEPLGEHGDILVNPPQVEADVAFFFKEAHRFEQRQRGSSLVLWKAVRARRILVSLPTSSLSGRHNLIERQRALVYGLLEGQPWAVEELVFEGEMVFVIEKQLSVNR